MVLLIVLDIEGVLALPGGSEHPWPLEAMLRLRRVLADAPAGTVLCTGRQEPYGEAMVQALALFRPLPEAMRERALRRGHPLFGWPSILENGAYLYDPLAKRPFPLPTLMAADAELIRRVRSEILVPLAERTGALVEAGKDYSISVNPPLLRRDAVERQSPARFVPVVEQALEAHLDRLEIKYSHSAIDITPAGVSKAAAVRFLLDLIGLQPEEVLGVGDTEADADWLRLVGHRAAPANGREALPGLDYYSPLPVIDGLLEILERLRARDWMTLPTPSLTP